jgi:uncharacterized membrane protein
MANWRECHWFKEHKIQRSCDTQLYTGDVFIDSRAFDIVHWFGLACLVFYLLLRV